MIVGGDLGYSRGPEMWIANMDGVLGPDFPVLAVVGNHEDVGWPVYQRWLERRVETVPDLNCEGEIGVKAHCTFHGLSIIQTAPGVHEVDEVDGNDDYAGYLARRLAEDENVWRICSWHKNQRDMQLGDKTDEVGWAVYEACREGGGFVATGHEHSYSRTFLLSDFEEKTIVHRSDHLEVGPGQSFAFVSGLGGKAIRPQRRRDEEWWAARYTATQSATHGALFCEFDGRQAECYFESISGGVPDRFSLVSLNAPEPVPEEDVAAGEDDESETVEPYGDALASGEANTSPDALGADVIVTDGESAPVEPDSDALASDEASDDDATGTETEANLPASSDGVGDALPMPADRVALADAEIAPAPNEPIVELPPVEAPPTSSQGDPDVGETTATEDAVLADTATAFDSRSEADGRRGGASSLLILVLLASIGARCRVGRWEAMRVLHGLPGTRFSRRSDSGVG